MTGRETEYITQAVKSGKLSGNGIYTKKCHNFFEKQYSFKKCLLTTSCTDALEMAAILINIQPGDEVIIPSFTFVSTANAFVLRGANIVFADSNFYNPNIDANSIEKLITSKTKAIVPVHYSGIACDMDLIMDLSIKYDLFVIEDAAQAIDSYYTGKDGKKRALGSIGHLGAFSFHETKNLISGEGGMLTINDERFISRAEIIWEKGTNRSAFFRGEINRYGWQDIGSSYLPSELTAAFLWAQIENLDRIQSKRKQIWNRYFENLEGLNFRLPIIPDYATNNGHIFYLLFNNYAEREKYIGILKRKNIFAVFHYLSLHKSPYYKNKYKGEELKWSDFYSDVLLRLPLYYTLSISEIDKVINTLRNG